MDQPVRLAIDLGTTHTVAVVRRDHHQPARALIFDGTPLLASAGHLTPDGTVHTGRDAVRLGGTDPQRYEPHPKRRVDDGTLLLGTDEVPVERLLTATLRRVADEARTAGIDPTGATVLTCPADWGQPRRTLLRTAAADAGLGTVRLLDEPVAAATYCAQILHQQIPVGGSIGIFDFGGGTLDVAVVRRDPTGLRVLATGGLDDLGGLDIDDALVAHLGQLVELRDPEQWRRLRHPETPAERRDRQAFWAEVRAAKEMLSRTASAPVQVPGRDDPLHLTRDELDRIAGPLVARAVDETRRTLDRAGIEARHLNSLLLVGGSSRLPLVASRLHARLGIAPTVPEQPELPVAYGAVHHTGPEPRHPATPPGHPTSGPPGYPTSGAPVPPRPVPSPVPPAGRLAQPPAPAPRPATPRPAPPANPRRRRIRRLLVTTTAFLAVAGCVSTVVVGGEWLNNQITGLGILGPSSTPAGTLDQVNAHASTRRGTAAVTVRGTDVISAVAGNRSTEVVALTASAGPPRWTTTLPIEPTDLRLTAVEDLIIVDGEDSVTNGGENVRAVLSGKDGKVLWQRVWPDRIDVAYYGTDAVVETLGSSDDVAISRINLRTGRQLWSKAGEPDLLTSGEHRAEPVRQWTTPGTPAPGALPAVAGTLNDAPGGSSTIVELDSANDRGYVLDAKTGKVRGSGKLPLEADLWTAHDNAVIGKTTGDDHVLAAYAVPTLRFKWKVPLAAGDRVERIKPCASKLVCVAITNSVDHRVIALDTGTGKQRWSATVEHSDENWYAHGDMLVTGRGTFDTISDPRLVNGTSGDAQKPELPESASLEATADGRLLLSTVGGSPPRWHLQVEDTTVGQGTNRFAVGEKRPEQVAIDDHLVGVVTADRRTLVLNVSGLPTAAPR
ncbi:Hsp70 family protein [Plantactinospora sp. KLBMP9567]|uniref:Hsp70 family protein n=1 Tax=Plantactinospora sp. KLBMP9567 TaxID=3085900 RepID=UPI002980EB06|nr:Hsp70 family protein [Plantactinospora sp. KLBMP9567]MDW5325804.1 Hsp70 family protein [Plantactinospora sp. KLBMP9567]